jgi:hypothetical protein
LTVDLLEVRQLLSTAPLDGPSVVTAAGQTVHPLYEVGPLVLNTNPPAGAYTPAQITSAYGFNAVTFGSVKGDGTGQTIAIVDAYDDPNIQADLNAFDAQFNLPATTVTRAGQSATSSLPGTDSSGGWELEESLDVEWAHAIAPGAKIVLVEANSTSDLDLLAGVTYASSLANVVSMSWGGGEFSGENSYDGDFSKAGVAFVASSGDNGAPISWPAASPNVIAVGGTALTLGSGNTYGSESGWSGSGGGPSSYESQPSYQSGVVTQTTMRANPDVAYDASPSTGFAVYDSFAYSGTSYGWLQIGGTSAGAPQWSALLAIADQGRALSSQAALDSTGAQQVQTTLYANAKTGDFHDITTGASTGTPNYNAGAGYDYVTGLGSPVANLVIQSLDGIVTAPPSDHLVVASATTDVAGNSLSVTVTADNASNAADAGFTGTVQFSSTDAQAGLPSSYTFTSADKGSHTFSVTLKTAGSQTVTASDAAISSSVTTSPIAVSPAAASQFVLSGLSSTATAGAVQTLIVTAKDPYGNVATGYTGSVSFASSDTAASLPGSYTFTTADKGSHTFSLTFKTAGTQSVTVSDTTTTKFSASQSGITVSPAAPLNLAASAASSGQINLTWTGSAGATGYIIQRSLSSTGGWAQIGTTAAGTTTYSDTGLASGTTYYYRAQAAGGSGSAYSNTATATTTGAAPATTTDTLWANSYTPSENYYASGSYDVGVKFESSVAGTVTGARFYKQTWMGGYTHVGYLWSSSGQLLASATFTGETSYGWQQVSFSSPVAIAANTVYIVSFSTGGGYFGITSPYFSSAAYTNGPLEALPSSTSGGNGVYGSGNGSFPKINGGGMSFWADVAFSPTSSSGVKTAAQVASTTGLVAPSAPARSAATASVSVGSRASSVPGQVTTVVPQASTLASFRRRGFVSDVFGF